MPPPSAPASRWRATGLRPGGLRAGGLKDDRPLLTGVASRLAGRLGASPLVVRVAFVVAGLAAGTGVVVYLVALVLLAGRPDPPPRPVTLRHNLGVVALASAVLVVAQGLVPGIQGALLWPVALVAFALALAEQPPTSGPERAGRAAAGRVLAGLGLMLAGSLAALAAVQGVGDLVRIIPAAAVLVGGLVLVGAPWVRGVVAAESAERERRVRAEARADVAAHLHDSVLQTLTLIQQRAGEPEVAAALAHHQERELRRWLYGPGGEDDGAATTLRRALEAAAAEVEDQYMKIIECIVVGDAVVDEEGTALVGAAREAMVNASKFAGTSLISVYAEVTADPARPGRAARVEVFVRDRGTGFDPAAVPADRRGISDSIHGRLARVGGDASVRSSPGGGTEVALRWPA